MGTKEMLISEIENLPEPFVSEVLDFVFSINERIRQEKLGATVASESSLEKDWLKPEEEEAWQDL
jgi:hypothetical protein